MTAPDTYILNSQAPHLGLYLKPCANSDRAYDVYRAADDECLLVAGSRVQVTAYLRGYEAAQAPKGICIGCQEKVDRDRMIDSAWLYGLVCHGCAEGVIEDVEAALTVEQAS